MRNITCLLLLAVLAVAVISTPLDDYVNAPDPHYKYDLLDVYNQTDSTCYLFNMTSQKWKDETVLNRPIWWHTLYVNVPKKITRPGAAFMLIDGGSNSDHPSPPSPDDKVAEMTQLISVSTGIVTAVLRQIPNQPIVFYADPNQERRTEDAVIAWTWYTFINNFEKNVSDPYTPLRMPMTKAVVRAMDTIEEFSAKIGIPKVEKFMLTGASKMDYMDSSSRSATQGLCSCTDCNGPFEGFHSHFRALGGWTFAFHPYYVLNITDKVDTPGLRALAASVDPASYYDRYKDTKLLVINTSGDEFFLPQDTRNYWSDLVAATDGAVLMNRIPNADHYFKGHELSMFFNLRSFFMSVYDEKPLPKVVWSFHNNVTHGITEVLVDTTNGRPAPTFAKIYHAQTLNKKKIDFRFFKINPDDQSKPLPNPVLWLATEKNIDKEQTPTGLKYTAYFEKPLPDSGWLGFYVQFSFPGPLSTTLQVTTETNILPETYPVPDCYRESCLGTLV